MAQESIPSDNGGESGVGASDRSAMSGVAYGAGNETIDGDGFPAESPPAVCASWPAGDGEMAARIRAFDWAATPLGSSTGWPPSLKTAVAMALDSALPTFVWWGPELTQLYNDAAVTIHRAKHPAALGCPARRVWSEIWPDVGPLFAGVLETGVPFMAEDLELLPDRGGPKEPAYFTFCYSALRDEAGSIAGMQAVAIETTGKVRAAAAQQQAQAALRESEQRQSSFLLELSDALRPLADPLAIEATVTGAIGAYLGVSRAFFVNITSDETTAVVRRDYAAGVPSMAGSYQIENFPLSVEQLRTGRPFVVDDVRSDGRFGAEERERLAALALVGIVSIPVVKNGAWVGGLTAGYDAPHAWAPAEVALLAEIAERTWAAIERREAEAALHDSEARYRTLFTSLNVGFCTIRVLFDAAQNPVDYVFLDVNPAFEAQTGLVDVVGSRMRELRSAHEEHWFEMYGRIALTGHPERFENLAAALGRWYSVDAFRIGPPENREVGVLFEDITGRKRAEAERQNFVDAAAHDLRTPLTSLKGRAQLLRIRARRGHLADVDALASGLEAMEADANRMAALIDEMLDAAHVQSGRLLELNPFPTDLAALAQTVAEETRLSTTQHEVRVVAEASGLVGEWDELRLRRVVANLLGNAVKYSPNGGEIVVRVGRDEDAVGAWAVITVSDQGVGIPGSDLPHLFERFHRGRNTSAIRGTGIGLAGARQIVEQHGGAITVASVEGQGSTFTVRLPLQAG